jgi:hypothetical protein
MPGFSLQRGIARNYLFTLLLKYPTMVVAQSDEDAFFIKAIHDEVLQNGRSYEWLSHLSEEIGGRLSGSEEAELAIEYTAEELKAYADTVYLQQCNVLHWERGRYSEKIRITDMPGGAEFNLNGTSLGNTVGTGRKGITGEVVQVSSLDEVRELGFKNLYGKIVFFNRPFDQTEVNPFNAYGGAVDQRINGPSVASENGAIGVVVRSMTSSFDNFPHTGVTQFNEGVQPIPAMAVSTKDASTIERFLRRGPIKLYMETHGSIVDTAAPSHNVIAEIKGSEFPEEVILVGGHLDSWDLGGGAHDDGAGCVHVMDVLRTMKALNYQPKRTIRCVLFMNEENGLGGATAYADSSNAKKEYHLAALESDSGGFTPRGFTFDAEDEVFAGYYQVVNQWLPLLEPYFLSFSKGGSGADISNLKSQKGLLIGFRTDPQRYFDFHHTRNDRIDAVNERELKMGAASITSLIYLIDKYGLTSNAE